MTDNREQSYNEWLVINSQLGDANAFNQLLVNWQQRLLSYANRRLGDREAAREVVQDCLLGITRGIRRLRDPAAFPAWSYRLLERRCVDFLRRTVADRKHLRSASPAELEKAVGVVDGSARLDDEISVARALEMLDSSLVVILKLYYQESFSIAEIARIMEIPEGTVKSRLYYARKFLAEILEDGQ